PALVSIFFEGLKTFKLKVPPDTTIDDFEFLIRVAKEYSCERSVFPLIEDALIPRVNAENAFYLYFLGQDNDMQRVCDGCLTEVQTNLDDDTVVSILDAIQQEEFEGEKEMTSPMINCCLNYVIDRLPHYFTVLRDAYDPLTKEWTLCSRSPSEEENRIIDLLNQFSEFSPLMTRVGSHKLHKLEERELQWVLDNLPENLEALNLSHFSFKELISLDKFFNLKSLTLANCNNLLWMNSLKKMSGCLEHLDLTNCTSLKNIAPVASLEKLKSFYFQGCDSLSETALEAIGRFPNIVHMKLRYSDSTIDRLITRIAEEKGWVIQRKAK
ncbi:MAG: hypothetical protein K940chlam7_01788, partial [Chlamydiae bacterium]|nr:hypothetical protein [Chlamydiota bacterium]